MGHRSTKDLILGVADTETDPFGKGKPEIKPFVAGLLIAGEPYREFWGENCVDLMVRHVLSLPGRYLIYMHNGGKFDFHFMLEWLGDNPLVINGRLTEWVPQFANHKPKIVFRDSFSILPVALDKFGQKQKIDYRIMHRDQREKPSNRRKISEYLQQDCVALFNAVHAFAKRFGDKGNIPLTIGSTALRKFKEHHAYDKFTKAQDAEFRPYYFGGRVQCFEAGILKGPWQVYDVNSSYPAAMRNFDHPVSSMWDTVAFTPRLLTGNRVWFARVVAHNKQALPFHSDDGTCEFGLSGPQEFTAISHELVPAIRAGLVEVLEWREIMQPARTARFVDFVDIYYAEKVEAKRQGDIFREIFSKLLLNSCYGKFGSNPENYREYKVLFDIFRDKLLARDGYVPELHISDDPFIELWSRPVRSTRAAYHNVAIAASITSASRSIMLDGLLNSMRPIYCDTDSVICRDFHGEISGTELGAWKHEKTAEYAAIAGKKMYCLYNRTYRRSYPVKWASKGGNLDPLDIIDIARGSVIEQTSLVPTFSLKAGTYYLTRKFTKTIENPQKFG